MSTPHTGDLKIMSEYECSPFWVAAKGSRRNVTPESLGIPPELDAEIREWDLTYQETYVRADPISSGFPDEAGEEAFNAHGRDLAVRTARALGPGWSVQYYDTLEEREVSVSESTS